MKTLKFYAGFLLVAVMMAGVLSCGEKKKEAQEVKKGTNDYVIVLDTSQSMLGKAGGKNIFESVKGTLNSFIDKMLPEDTFTFITFDQTVKVFPMVKIQSENDKDIVKKYVSTEPAKGMWTYTMEMFKEVIKKTYEIDNSQKGKGRQIVLIILTDALDDPPPTDKKDRLSIKDIAKEYSPSDWFIYFVNLGELQTNKAASKVVKDLQGISPNAALIEGQNPDTKIGEDIEANIAKMNEIKRLERRKLILTIIGGIGGFIVLMGLFAFIFNLIMSKYKVFGTLMYKNEAVLGANFESVDLAKFDSKRVTVGKDSLSEIRIYDLESPQKMIFEAVSVKGSGIRVKINQEKGLRVAFANNKKDSVLVNGDEFSAAGYHFVYRTQPAK